MEEGVVGDTIPNRLDCVYLIFLSGYAKLHIINSTTLFVEQLLSEGKNGTDSFYYVQTQASRREQAFCSSIIIV